MAGTKYEELQAAIRDYGQAAFQNLMRCRALGEAVIAGFHAYEGCGDECVAGVPAEGPFDPRKEYGEEAFSFHGQPVIKLEPVRFGVSLIVGNAEDHGALWLRTVISCDIAGDGIDVFVGEQPALRLPIEFEGALEPVFEAIHREFLETFTLEVAEFQDKRFKTGIGFMPV